MNENDLTCEGGNDYVVKIYILLVGTFVLKGGIFMSYNDYLRYPKTANERKQYYIEPELVRAKRSPIHLPTAWDDYVRCMQRSWKVQGKKRKQHGYDQKLISRMKCETN